MCHIWIMGILGRPEEEEREKGMEEIFEMIMTENFIQINAQYQITGQGRSENTVKSKCESTPRHIIFKLHKIKYKNSKRRQKKRTPDLQRNKDNSYI